MAPAAEPSPSATPTEEPPPAPSATPTHVPTATPTVPTPATPTATPPTQGEIIIEGLDAFGLGCSQLVFYRGDEELARVDLRGHADGRVTYPWGTADRLVFLGSPDGQCPWSQFTLRDLNPDRIAIADRVLRLRFDRIVRTPRPTEPAGST